MFKYQKLAFSVLLFFISALSLNHNVYSSHIKYQCVDDGAAEPILVKSIKIEGAGEKTLQRWINLIKEREEINNTNESKAKGVLGEIAAQVLFEQKGYTIIENAAHRLIGCTVTTKVSNRGEGIDGIFLRKKFLPIFNEAKFRSKGCHLGDLPCTSYGQEASIQWYSYHFSHLRDNDMTKSPQCADLNFKELEDKFHKGNILRTMTCLNKKGEIDLYYIKDKNEKNNKNARSFLKSFMDLEREAINNVFAKLYGN